VTREGQEIGTITSAIWSPRLERNVGLAIIENAEGNTGKPIEVKRPDTTVSGSVSYLPFA
jgi:aminomethyltransferase